jgi:hypothetical protein
MLNDVTKIEIKPFSNAQGKHQQNGIFAIP